MKMSEGEAITPGSRNDGTPKFEILPERQAKIAGLLNSSLEWDIHSYCKPASSRHEDGEVEYCICRSKDTSRFMICCDLCNIWFHGDCVNLSEKKAKDILQYFCVQCKERDPALEIQYKKKKPRANPVTEKKPKDPGNKDKRGRKARRCGECIACYRVEDCGRCDFCKDMRKFGGPNKIRQKCRQRQCLNFGLVLGRSSFMREKYRSRSPFEDTSDTEFKNKRVLTDISKSRDNEVNEDDDEDDDDELYEPQKKRGRKKPSFKKGRSAKKGKDSKIGYSSSSSTEDHGHHRKHHHHRYREGERDKRHHRKRSRCKDDTDDLKQCYGPSCTQAARPSSKYCSEECGIKLAVNRIYHILPQRIQQWNTIPCAADENAKKQLDIIRNQQLKARKLLANLDQRSHQLEKLIQYAKQTPIAPEQENTDGEEEVELSYYCVTCGLKTGQKPALRHMEKCFNKYESQTSFGSVFKTRIEGSYNMFCDTYNAQQGTYCKRLRVLCPEHSKEPKIPDDEVCGCPLVSDVFKETGEFCRIPRRKCNKHYCWEKLRRAEIDMDRVRQWLTLDDLMEQERAIRSAMADRAGVLGLMLHSTVSYETAPPLIGVAAMMPTDGNIVAT